MRDLTLAAAQTIIAEAMKYARQQGYTPMTVVVLDDRAAVKAVGSEDGASLGRFDIARGKAFGCLAFDLGARAIGSKAQIFVNAVGQLRDVNMVPVAGGVLLRKADNSVIGAVGISGDSADNDEKAAVAGIEAAGFVADTGADG